MNEISPKEVSDLHNRITQELSKVIVGQEQIVRLLLASLFARGHCLLVGVPGLAKTLIVRTLAEILHLSFKRIQFTPDLMPGDIIGSEILQERERRLEFEYQPGPIFANLMLADEINRTPPKTQAALLEAMQERKVTVGGQIARRCPIRFWWWPRKTPSNRKALIRCPKRSSTASCFRCIWIIRPRTRKWKSSGAPRCAKCPRSHPRSRRRNCCACSGSCWPRRFRIM